MTRTVTPDTATVPAATRRGVTVGSEPRIGFKSRALALTLACSDHSVAASQVASHGKWAATFEILQHHCPSPSPQCCTISGAGPADGTLLAGMLRPGLTILGLRGLEYGVLNEFQSSRNNESHGPTRPGSKLGQRLSSPTPHLCETRCFDLLGFGHLR